MVPVVCALLALAQAGCGGVENAQGGDVSPSPSASATTAPSSTVDLATTSKTAEPWKPERDTEIVFGRALPAPGPGTAWEQARAAWDPDHVGRCLELPSSLRPEGHGRVIRLVSTHGGPPEGPALMSYREFVAHGGGQGAATVDQLREQAEGCRAAEVDESLWFIPDVLAVDDSTFVLLHGEAYRRDAPTIVRGGVVVHLQDNEVVIGFYDAGEWTAAAEDVLVELAESVANAHQ